MNPDLIGLIIGFTLTLLLYSYLFIGNRAPYRLAIHILVGASAAFAAVIVIQEVIVPLYSGITENPSPSEAIFWLVPIIFLLFLLLRRLRVASWLGNSTIALLIGVGAPVALLGALTGTLIPQLTAVDTSGGSASAVRSLIIAVLAAFTLLSFQFTSFRSAQNGLWERSAWQRFIYVFGRAILMITFGALFATVLNTSFILLADRINFYINAFSQWLS